PAKRRKDACDCYIIDVVPSPRSVRASLAVASEARNNKPRIRRLKLSRDQSEFLQHAGAERVQKNIGARRHKATNEINAFWSLQVNYERTLASSKPIRRQPHTRTIDLLNKSRAEGSAGRTRITVAPKSANIWPQNGTGARPANSKTKMPLKTLIWLT